MAIGLQVYKVETIGDSYMTVGGVPERNDDHCEILCHLALGMLFEARSVTDPVTEKPLQIRLGINSGPIVAGVIGKKMPRYYEKIVNLLILRKKIENYRYLFKKLQ